MRSRLTAALAAFAMLGLSPSLAMAEDVQNQLRQMQDRLQQMEDKLQATNDQLDVANQRVFFHVEHFAAHLRVSRGMTDGDDLPALVSPELGERQPIRDLQGVLVLRDGGRATQYAEGARHG